MTIKPEYQAVLNSAQSYIDGLTPARLATLRSIGLQNGQSVDKGTISRAISFIEGLQKDLDNPANAAADIQARLKSDIERNIALLRRYIGDQTVGRPKIPTLDNNAQNIRQIGENVLSDYINVMYHVSLSMMPFAEATKYQAQMQTKAQGTTINLNDMTANVRPDRTVTLASTGEIFRNQQYATSFSPRTVNVPDNLGGGGNQSFTINDVESTTLSDPRNYYNITDMVIETNMAPSKENTSVATMLSMKMRISEPMGFKLIDDIKKLAYDQGYKNVHHQRAIYRIDLWWSGYKMYDKNDPTVPIGTWVPNIPVYNDYTGSKSVTPISFYVTARRIEAEVTGNGTVYDCDFIPAGGIAFQPNDAVIDAGSFKTGEVASVGTLGSFLDSLEVVLPKMRLDNSMNRINRDYKFYAPQWLRDAKLGGSKNDRLSTLLGALAGSNPTGAPMVNSNRGTTVIDLLNAAFADCPTLQDYFLADDPASAAFVVPRVHMSIRFNAKYYQCQVNSAASPPATPQVDPDLNDFKYVTLEYIIEPYLTFKAFTADIPSKVKSVADPNNQLQRVRNLIKYGMLTRIYNYIWTGMNTEILDLELKFKNFFFLPLWKGTQDGAAMRGTGADAPAVNPFAKTDGLLNNTSTDSLIKQLFGTTQAGGIQEASSVFSGTDAFSIFNSTSMNTGADIDPINSNTSDRDRVAKYHYYENDHMESDLLRIDGMNIKGDPVWLLGPYVSSPLNALQTEPGVSTTGSNDINIQPQTDRVFFLRFNVPVQNDYMNPNFFASGLNKYPNIMSGFYQVIKVTSSFAGGKFTQKVDATKIANLNFIEQIFQSGPNAIYVRASSETASVQGNLQTSGSSTNTSSGANPTGVSTPPAPTGTPQISRPLTVDDVKAADAYLNRTDPSVSSANLTKQQKILVAQNFFVKAGYTSAQASAIVGNMIGESQMVTDVPGDFKNGVATSLGIMQWHDTQPGVGRKTNLLNFAKTASNTNPYDLLTQLQFALSEFQTVEKSAMVSAVGPPGQPTGSEAQMTQGFMAKVERPDAASMVKSATTRSNGASDASSQAKQAQQIRTANNLPGG